MIKKLKNIMEEPLKFEHLFKSLIIIIALLMVQTISICITFAPSDDKKIDTVLDRGAASDSYRSEEFIVYTTDTGKCYHREGCNSLRHSKRKTDMRTAMMSGYHPCENCNPPSDHNS